MKVKKVETIYTIGIIIVCIIAITMCIIAWYYETFYIRPKIRAKQIELIIDELDEDTRQKIVNEVNKK